MVPLSGTILTAKDPEMLLIDPDGIPGGALAVMKYAEDLGARVSGWGGGRVDDWGIIGCTAPRGAVSQILDHVHASEIARESIKDGFDFREPILLVSGASDLAKVALTMAGFVRIEEVWIFATKIETLILDSLATKIHF